VLKILCIGNQWRGANDGAMFRAFSRLGHLVEIADHMAFLPSELWSFSAKVAERLARPILVREYNVFLKKQFALFRPDLVVAYKAPYFLEETLHDFKAAQTPVVCVYPDVSTIAHGPNIPKCMPLYDHVFTTKSFGIKDLEILFGIQGATYLPHGFDPDIHRRLPVSAAQFPHLACEASFIGTFSEKKEALLGAVAQKSPGLNLKVWGGSWHRAKHPALGSALQLTGIHGDLYAVGIQLSKINLGILSAQVQGASSGDQITSRTFHIPGSGGFMLHERTEELLQYFTEDVDVATFTDAEDLCDKIRFYLKSESAWLRIAEKGHETVHRHHKIDHRAQFVLEKSAALGLISPQKI